MGTLPSLWQQNTQQDQRGYCSKRIDSSNAAMSDVERFSKLIQKYTSFEELDSFMLHELIEKITIYETPNMGRYRKGKEKIVTIYYKFVGALQ